MADEFDQYKATIGGDFDNFKIDPNATLDSSVPQGPGLRAGDNPQDVGGKLSKWAQNVQEDLKYGTDLTGVGTLLKKMGAHGLYNGGNEKIADILGSLPLGLAQATEGVGDIMSKGPTMSGMGKLVGGTAQAATIPLAFSGAQEVPSALEASGRLIPSAERAGKAFQEIKSAAGAVPINVNGPGQVAFDMFDNAEAGAGLPKVIKKFIARVTDPSRRPLTYAEARDFYSNATNLSAKDNLSMSNKTRAQLGEFVRLLDNSLTDAADVVGRGKQYSNAMTDYHRAMQVRRAGQGVVDLTKSKILQGLGAYGVYRAVTK